jgi:hypothetical protein
MGREYSHGDPGDEEPGSYIDILRVSTEQTSAYTEQGPCILLDIEACRAVFRPNAMLVGLEPEWA